MLFDQELQETSKIWLMGDPFLRAYYSIYDLDKKRIGLVGRAKTTKSEDDSFLMS